MNNIPAILEEITKIETMIKKFQFPKSLLDRRYWNMFDRLKVLLANIDLNE
jgi:hypothetical protein